MICSDDESENLLEEVDFAQPVSCESDENDHESDEDFIPYKARNTKILLGAKEIATSTIINSPIHFSCGFCKEYFSSFEILSQHMKKKTCFTEKFDCKECCKEFPTKRHLYSHNQIHKKKVKVMCEACAKEFNSQFDLVNNLFCFFFKNDFIYLLIVRSKDGAY